MYTIIVFRILLVNNIILIMNKFSLSRIKPILGLILYTLVTVFWLLFFPIVFPIIDGMVTASFVWNISFYSFTDNFWWLMLYGFLSVTLIMPLIIGFGNRLLFFVKKRIPWINLDTSQLRKSHNSILNISFASYFIIWIICIIVWNLDSESVDKWGQSYFSEFNVSPMLNVLAYYGEIECNKWSWCIFKYDQTISTWTTVIEYTASIKTLFTGDNKSRDIFLWLDKTNVLVRPKLSKLESRIIQNINTSWKYLDSLPKWEENIDWLIFSYNVTKLNFKNK